MFLLTKWQHPATIYNQLRVETCDAADESGRDRRNEVRWGPRLLDLDLLLWENLRIESRELTLPHPRMEDRLFVLAPLAEIAPDLRLRGCGATVEERVRQLKRAGVPQPATGR